MWKGRSEQTEQVFLVAEQAWDRARPPNKISKRSYRKGVWSNFLLSSFIAPMQSGASICMSCSFIKTSPPADSWVVSCEGGQGEGGRKELWGENRAVMRAIIPPWVLPRILSHRPGGKNKAGLEDLGRGVCFAVGRGHKVLPPALIICTSLKLTTAAES